MEFDQQIDVEPFRPKPHPPDDVVQTLAQVVGDIAVARTFQGGEVQIIYPILMHEAAQQVGDHLGVGEQELVAVVMVHLVSSIILGKG